MHISNWLEISEQILQKANISTSRLDCLVLLEDFTSKDRSWLLAHQDYELGDTYLLNKMVKRRAQHEPLAYIRGKSEFYGREFMVNKHTLEPRPETETMIDILKKLVKPSEKVVIVDVGTGSGNIAITAKLELPKVEVWAIDIDKKCIETAMKNANILGANINFCLANLLADYEQGMCGRAEDAIICANLPYVPAEYQLNQAAKFEPKHAIFGGEDGLDFYHELFNQINMLHKLRYSAEYITPPQYVLTESLLFQHDELARIAQNAGYSLEKTEDLIQVFKLKNN